MPGQDDTLTLVGRDGATAVVPVSEAGQLLDRGWRLEAAEDRSGRLATEAREEQYGGVRGAVGATAAALARGATLGGSDVLVGAIGGDDARETLRGLRDVNPGLSTGAEIIGGIAPALAAPGSVLARTPAGAVASAGRSITGAAEGAGAIAKIGAATRAGVAEGALYGGGAGVSELALSDDPLTFERAASTLSSNMLYGGLAGGGVSLGLSAAGRAVEKGLAKSKQALDTLAERTAASEGAALPDDIATLVANGDAKGIRAARELELEAIETARVPQRKALADDLAAFRREGEETKIWLATQGAKERDVRKIGKLSLDADRSLDRTLRNPKALATKPERALEALQQQEHALEQIAAKADDLRMTFATDTSGARAKALDAVPAALERNRALQAKISELTAAPKSARLAAVEDAKLALASGGAAPKRTLADQMLGGTAFTATSSAVHGLTGLASAIPIVGPAIALAGHVLAPLAGARVAGMATDKVFGRMAKASAEVAARTQKAVAAFLDVGKKVAPAAPVLASKVLSEVRYAPSETARAALPKATARVVPKLTDSYRARSAELRSQVSIDPATGAPAMRREARAAMATRLAGVRAVAPVLADRMESLAARRVEFLASKLPRRPDLGVMQFGPDTWTPSDMEMRAFARYAAAVEDPAGVEDRLAAGKITPEDAEAMNAVYPERVAEIKRQIIEQLPTLQKTLPYAKRLALSIFTGVPVDPAMHPGVLAVLQGQYAAEPDTNGGIQAPRPQPAFGSVRAEQPTKAQSREQEG